MSVDNDDCMEKILDGEAILLVGSGFSLGAENLRGDSFLTGMGLRDHFGELAGLTEKNYRDHALTRVANHYRKKMGDKAFVEELKNLFSAYTVCDYHNDIISLPWKRIYTTNYDNVIEKAAENSGQHKRSVTSSEPVEGNDKSDLVIHLNGYIDRLTEKTLFSEFKLLLQSYTADSEDTDSWISFMGNDFLSAKYIVVIGFSIANDLSIGHKLSLPGVSEKTLIIAKSQLDPIEKDELMEYGTVLDCGVKDFSSRIMLAKNSYVSSIISDVFSCFDYSHRMPLGGYTLGQADYVNFYYKGIYKQCFFQKDKRNNYISVVRRKRIDNCVDHNRKKVYLITSHIGGGKSVFCEILRCDLQYTDSAVFFLKERYDKALVLKEIENICTNYKNAVVIIDDCYSKMNIVKCFSQFNHSGVCFVLTARKSLSDSVYKKIKVGLGLRKENIEIVDLQFLSEVECSELAKILYEASMVPPTVYNSSIVGVERYLKNDCASNMANIVLDLYKSSFVREKLELLIKEAMQRDEGLRHVVVLALANSVWKLELQFEDIINILDINFCVLKSEYHEIIAELFFDREGTYGIKSPIIARALLNDLILPQYIGEGLSLLLRKIVNNTFYVNEYSDTIKAAISHANFDHIISRESGAVEIKKFYDSLRNLPTIKDNPFYWEEFAVSLLDVKDFFTAKHCIDQAYKCAKEIRSFVPFQICTIEADYDLRKILNELDEYDGVAIADCVGQAIQKMLRYYEHPQNNKTYIFSVSRNVLKIFDMVKRRMDRRAASIYISATNDLKQKLCAYLEEDGYRRDLHEFNEKLQKTIDEAKRI